MEDLKLALTLWAGIGIAACLIVLCFLLWYKKHRPNFLTPKASLEEKIKLQKIVIGFLGSFIIYSILFMLVVAQMVYKSVPYGLGFVGIVYIVCVILLILPIRRK